MTSFLSQCYQSKQNIAFSAACHVVSHLYHHSRRRPFVCSYLHFLFRCTITLSRVLSTLLHYLFKLDLKLIFSRLFLANWLDLSASASEAIAPRHSTNRVLLLLLLLLLLLI